MLDNPPWDLWFPRLYFRFVRFLYKPCVIILQRRAIEFECFVIIFNRTVTRTIVSHGTNGEMQPKLLRSQDSKRKKKSKAVALVKRQSRGYLMYLVLHKPNFTTWSPLPPSSTHLSFKLKLLEQWETAFFFFPTELVSVSLLQEWTSYFSR